MIDRRTFSTLLASGTALAAMFPAAGLSAIQHTTRVIRNYDDLVDHVRGLVRSPYSPPEMTGSDLLKSLTPDQFQQIRFKVEEALWRGQSDFEIFYIKPGVYANDLVALNELNGQFVTPITYDLNDFDLGGLKADIADGHAGGFGGFKVVYPLHPENSWKDELIVFHGASYFRFLGRKQQYGLSARGIAINTALPEAEEFPVFREFWIEKPDPDSDRLSLLALLDGPSVCGAYRFTVTPGDFSVVDVQAELHLRKEVEKFGCAPLTSMFLHGESDQKADASKYPLKVHDSDGLALALEDGQMFWRPLSRRRGVTITQHFATNPKGFGLLQRETDPDIFDTPEKRYHKRPGYWVEPIGEWGRGHVQLVEIESIDVDFDNIAAFWVPESPPKMGEPISLNYRLTALNGNPPTPSSRGFAQSSSVIPLDLIEKRPYLRAAIRFTGLARTSGKEIDAHIHSPHGDPSNVEVTVRADGDVDVEFDMLSSDPARAEFYAHLTQGGVRMTEMWSYLWTV